MYTAYYLTEESRQKLFKHKLPQYAEIKAEHITVKFGVKSGEALPDEAEIKVIGYAEDKAGIEAFVVEVNGNTFREDGKLYHITHSFDPERFKPVDSNILLEKGYQTLEKPIAIEAEPVILK